MSISYWLDNSQKQKKTYDFVIVGGGIAGLSAAYWLQRQHPQARIALIEKNRLGFGASGRNAGFLTCGSTSHFIKLRKQFGLEKALEIWNFSEANRQLLLEHIIEDAADEVDYRQTGSCTVAPDEERLKSFQEAAQVMRAHNIDVHDVESAFMERDYGVTGFQGGIHYAGDGYIHPVKLLKRMFSKLHIDLYEGTEVFAFQKEDANQVVRTDQGDFETPSVLLTLNAYLPLVMPALADLVTAQRGQILVTQPLPHFVRGPCYLTKFLCYFRQLPTGELLIGGFRNLSLETENNMADQTTEVIQEALIRFVRERFKHGKEARVAYRWSGLMGFTPDEQMLIGPSPDNPQIHFMAGCSGHGMGLSFHAAKVLVDSLAGKAIPSHLHSHRFFKS